MNTLLRTSLILATVFALVGCQSLGPVTLSRDRLDYGSAIADSWKHQTLLNIIKLRYSDPPLFVDVGQIVGGYTLETSLSVSATNSSSTNQSNIGGGARYTDRPTVTYIPLTGQAFLTGLVTPISPASLLAAVQVGWPAETILPIGVISVNGIGNEKFVGDLYQEADPDFEKVVSLISRLQKSGSLTFRSEERDEKPATTMYLRKPGEGSPDADDELRRLLGLGGDTDSFAIVFGEQAVSADKVAIRTRSILNILQMLSTRVDVPPEHIAEGRASPGVPPTVDPTFGTMRILSATKPPENAFVDVNYRDMWFYIDDRDLGSKRIFALLMLLFTLADTGSAQSGPVLTIPTG